MGKGDRDGMRSDLSGGNARMGDRDDGAKGRSHWGKKRLYGKRRSQKTKGRSQWWKRKDGRPYFGKKACMGKGDRGETRGDRGRASRCRRSGNVQATAQIVLGSGKAS